MNAVPSQTTPGEQLSNQLSGEKDGIGSAGSGTGRAPGTTFDEVNSTTAEPRPFSGNPGLYRKFAWGGSVLIHAYLYFGFLFLHGHVGGAEWVFGWKPAVLAFVSCLVFARFAYRWIMRLDAQYGRGSGWVLSSRTVKLPEPRLRK